MREKRGHWSVLSLRIKISFKTRDQIWETIALMAGLLKILETVKVELMVDARQQRQRAMLFHLLHPHLRVNTSAWLVLGLSGVVQSR